MDPKAYAVIGSQQIGSTSNAIKERSANDNLHAALEHLSKARSMASAVAMELVGPVPTGVGDQAESGGEGLFGAIQRAADRINIEAASIIDDMQRVQRRL